MPLTLSATDVAIAVALEFGTLTLVTRPSRFGGEFIAIEDDKGVIEVALSQAEADARIADIKARAGAVTRNANAKRVVES